MEEVAFLKELISIPSLSGEEDAVATYLVQQMEDLGFCARRDDVGNALGTVGDPAAQRSIVLLGHMDTVPGSIPVRQEGDRLYGRGAVDAKGPLATLVLAAARVAPLLKGVRLVVVGAVEEEARGLGAHHLARNLPPPDCAIIGEPSGWQGITLGYKGTLTVDYRLAQPARHSAGEWLPPAEKAIAFWNRLTSYAAALNEGRGHSFGKALSNASAARAAQKVVDPHDEPLGDGRRQSRFDTLDVALRAIYTFGDGLEEGVEMSLGLRLPLRLELAALEQRMLTWCDGAQLDFPYNEPAYRSEKNIPPVRAFLRAIRAVGGRPRFKLKTGTSDMNVVGPAWGCPCVAYGPGDSALDHTPDEHIEIEEFRRAVDVLERVLETLIV